MRILYLSWGEVPRMASVYGGQLVEVAAEMKRQPGVEEVALVAGVPIIHSGLVREKWRYGEQIKRIRERLDGSPFWRIAIPTPPVGVSPTRSQLKFFSFGSTSRLARIIRNFQPDVVHCRSYVATYIALECRKKSGFDYRILFDSRSNLPDESVQSGRWQKNSEDHRFWRETEQRLIAQTEATTNVSEVILDQLEAKGAPRDKLNLIHLNAKISDGDAKQADHVGVERPLTLCYCGGLDEKGWHRPDELWRIFAEVVRHARDARLRVVTKSSHDRLRAGLHEQGFGEMLPRIDFTSAASPTESVRLMRDCDIGILSYFSPETEDEKYLAAGVFGTKVAEYLIAGLPVLANRYCGGAVRFLERHDTGIAYTPGEPLSSDQFARLRELVEQRDRIAATAREHFALGRNCERLKDIYDRMVASPMAS